jgi:hypothetical protein
MNILYELTDGPGYCVGYSLSPEELSHVNDMITQQYLERLAVLAPDLVERARKIGIEQYHQLPIPFDHGKVWGKHSRLLPDRCLAAFPRMRFYRQIEEQLGSVVISHDELNWRLVRPNQPGDVGPVHADKWFWDAGYGSMPEGSDRFKIWIPIHTEAGRNGLLVKPHSHKSKEWKHHFEVRDGINKPVLDERTEDLNMQLLPQRAGEMVMFNDEFLHGGAVNNGERCRVSLELTILFPLLEGKRRLEQYRRSGRAGSRAA